MKKRFKEISMQLSFQPLITTSSVSVLILYPIIFFLIAGKTGGNRCKLLWEVQEEIQGVAKKTKKTEGKY